MSATPQDWRIQLRIPWARPPRAERSASVARVPLSGHRTVRITQAKLTLSLAWAKLTLSLAWADVGRARVPLSGHRTVRITQGQIDPQSRVSRCGPFHKSVGRARVPLSGHRTVRITQRWAESFCELLPMEFGLAATAVSTPQFRGVLRSSAQSSKIMVFCARNAEYSTTPF